jgi:hypothetical protein
MAQPAQGIAEATYSQYFSLSNLIGSSRSLKRELAENECLSRGDSRLATQLDSNNKQEQIRLALIYAQTIHHLSDLTHWKMTWEKPEERFRKPPDSVWRRVPAGSMIDAVPGFTER